MYSQMIAGKDAVRQGDAKNSWLTETAAWNYVAISQAILGIQPDFDGLKINPCIPQAWEGYTVTRVFRGDTYVIEVRNPDRVSRGIKSLTIDGRRLEGCIVQFAGDGRTHRVEAVLG